MTLSVLTNSQGFELETTTLCDALERSAREGACFWIAEKDGEAVELSARALLEQAQRTAQHLLSLGLSRGERVIVMLPTSVHWLSAFFGTLLAGGTAVPVGPNLSFGGMDRYSETVAGIVRAAGARFLLCGRAIEPYLPTLRESGSPLEHLILVDAIGESAAGSLLPLPSPSPSDAAVIQYTSGTTGSPKGVVLSHRALLSNAFMIGERVQMSPADVGVSWLPLFHDMGLVGALLTALYWRYSLLLMPVESFLLQPRRWVQWLSRRRATLSVAPNFAYQFVVDRVSDRHLAGVDLSAWRCAFNGAEAVLPTTLTRFAERFGPLGFSGAAFQPVYGMAENSLAATFPDAGKRWHIEHGADGRNVVSVGTPLRGVSVAVVDEQRAPLPVGQIGDIRIKSPSLMDGYYRDEQATAGVLRDGWLDTGDIGFIQNDELFVSGRKKELIIKRGRNYLPEEIEGIALEAGRGRVLRAAVFGAPDEREGTERMVLVLETRPTSEHDRDLLVRDVSGAVVAALGVGLDLTLAVPAHTIERTTSGKIRRSVLRTRFLEGKLVEHARTSEALEAGSP